MSHDKIKAAARKRMAETGESYTAARREVIRESRSTGSDAPAGEPGRFAISYDDMGPVSLWTDTLFGGGPQGGRVEIHDGYLRLRTAGFKLDMPRAAVRGATRTSRETRGTIGVHSKGGSWLVNGSYDGLVAITIDPPVRTERRPSSLFLRMEVKELVVSLVDPDGFVAAVSHWLTGR